MLKHIGSAFQRYGFALERKLYVNDPLRFDPSNDSGIRATVFGPSGFLGRPICATLGGIGSHLIMPVSLEHNFIHSEHVKQLKLTGNVNKTWVSWEANLRDQKLIDRLIENSNVVINLAGPRKKVKHRADFEYINIEVAERIAKACARKGVHRLIHFSAAGADENSESLDFQTKAIGQQVVKKAFPNATIFRPCTVYGQNDYFASNMQRQAYFFWNHFVLVYDDCTALKQPIKDGDIGKCVLNALKMEESKGKTYELGGPHVLSMKDIHEIVFNTLKFKPHLAYVNKQWALKASEYLYNWQFFGKEYIIKRKESIDEVVKDDRYLTIKDLKVEPVSFKNGIYEIMREYVAHFYTKSEDYDN